MLCPNLPQRSLWPDQAVDQTAESCGFFLRIRVRVEPLLQIWTPLSKSWPVLLRTVPRRCPVRDPREEPRANLH